MKKLVSTLDMPREEWLRHRKAGLGGSDAGAVLGLNEYRSPLDVYLDKISDDFSDTEDSEAVRQGHDFEEYVARRFEEETGIKVRKTNYLYQGDEPFMLADVDRVIVGENAGLEIKTCSPYSADKWTDGKIPDSYLAQVAHYQAVMGWDYAYICCLVLGKELIIRKVERDEGLIKDIITVESDFWNNHVQKRVLPQADGSRAFDAMLNKYFSTTTKESIHLTGFDDDLRKRSELSDRISSLETERNLIDQRIKLAMQDKEIGLTDGYRISWAAVESSRLDTKRLREDFPHIYQKYSNTSSTRRFSVREVA